MSRRPATFTQADVARALRAAEQVAPGRMTIEIARDGTIRIRPLAKLTKGGLQRSKMGPPLPRVRKLSFDGSHASSSSASPLARGFPPRDRALGRTHRPRAADSDARRIYVAEFMAAYHAAIRGELPEPKAKRVDERSLEFLVRRWQASSSWAELAKATRRQRANILKQCSRRRATSHIRRSIRRISSPGARGGRTPSQANNFLNTMRALFRWAIEQEFVKIDPTEGVRVVKRPKTGGFKVWTEDEIERFKERLPLGTRERLAFAILRTTGLRRGDAATLGRST